MSLSAPFIRRPVGTTLLTIAITLAGALSYFFLPVSPLPQVEFPTISVSASLPGANPETMASAVATPLERQLGRIAGITEMTSSSSLGSTSIVLQFDLNRNIDAAARDVQAAINAARSQLPSTLPNNPSYRKVNPADAPIMILAMTSETYTKPKIYEAAATIVQQRLSQIDGVGQVNVGGGSSPAVRVSVNPTILNSYGLGMDDVRRALNTANANRPKGQISNDETQAILSTSDQLFKADEYRPIIITYRNGAPIRVGDVATVTDSVEDLRAAGYYNGQPAISLIIFRQPGANIIETVDRVKALLPQLREEIPANMNINISLDRTATIRESVHDVEFTLVLSIFLVILVVFIFLRDARATFIPSIAVPVSLIGTFGFMYLAGYSIDNLSLMALTIATGFVVDDAIVVIENISRHLEEGMTPRQAAFRGAREIGFTVLSISVSLVAVFIPILLMGGIIGRLFREFAVTLSVAIGVSLVISLTTTPMMCAYLLKKNDPAKRGWLYRASERVFDWILAVYDHSLRWVLRHQFFTLLVTLTTVALTVYLFIEVPKGFFPQQDTGRLVGNLQADQNISFQAMQKLTERFIEIVGKDEAVESVVASTGGGGGGGGGSINTARMFCSLKPMAVRQMSADKVIARLRQRLATEPGGTLILQSTQDLRIGGKASSAQYQYTLRSDSLKDINEWTPKLLEKLRAIPGVVDANSDQLNRGLQVALNIDRQRAAQLGISQQAVDDALYDAFGQRQVSTMYTPLNQFRVVMEVEPDFRNNPDSLRYVYVRGQNNTQIPLSALATDKQTTSQLSVNHYGQFPCVTFSFNLTPGTSLGQVVADIEQAQLEMGMPQNLQGSFQGAAQAFRDSLSDEPLLILAALVAVYIVLGILYESYIHPITILSTLPSAGVGALLALIICDSELNVMSLIGIILLIGIVKKNAIMMIDFALEAERTHGMSSQESIYQACILRFRPITMTTMAALLGGLPLAMGTGAGSEMRQPLGIAIVGGLIVSQMLTLYTTPVVYLAMDRLQNFFKRKPVPERFTIEA
jgi:multidrug efflux pump